MKVIAAAVALLLAGSAAALADDVIPRFDTGFLTCEVKGSFAAIVTSDRSLDCVFDGVNGSEHYRGYIKRIGLDVGLTGDSVLAWVATAVGPLEHGALDGDYAGIGGEATIGAGASANALVGGSSRGVVLQPISIGAQTGLSLAFGVVELRLMKMN